MPSIQRTWTTVEDAYGYRIHAGLVSTVYTHASDDIPADVIPDVAGNTKSGSVTVPTGGLWYCAVAAYDVNGYEGPYSDEVAVMAGSVAPPLGVLALDLE